MTFSPRAAALALGALLLALAVTPQGADAQRRRRRRSRPPPTEQAPPAPAAPEEPAPDGTDPSALPSIEAAPDAAALRDELAALLDDLVRARTRIDAVGRALFRTRLAVRLDDRSRRPGLVRFRASLDGAPVFDEDVAGSDGPRPVFDGFASPGPHVLRVEAEWQAPEGRGHRYALRDVFRVDVAAEGRTVVAIEVTDESDVARRDDGEGAYDVRVRLRLDVEPLPEGEAP